MTFRPLEVIEQTGKPALPAPWENVRIVYTWIEFLNAAKTGPWTIRTVLPDADSVRAVGAADAAAGRTLVVLDVETPTYSDSEVDIHIQLVAWYKEGFGGPIDVGFYSSIPWHQFLNATSQNGSVGHGYWTTDNSRWLGKTSSLAMTCPSLYTETLDIDVWRVYAKNVISEARRLANVPCYPFLWMEYANWLPFSLVVEPGTMIPVTYWRQQLDYLRSEADGVFLWGARDLTWDPVAPWWVETQNFVADLTGTMPEDIHLSLSTTQADAIAALGTLGFTDVIKNGVLGNVFNHDVAVLFYKGNNLVIRLVSDNARYNGRKAAFNALRVNGDLVQKTLPTGLVFGAAPLVWLQ